MKGFSPLSRESGTTSSSPDWALAPTLAAAERGLRIALANKESLVVAGTLRLVGGRFFGRALATVAGNVAGAAVMGAALIHGADAPTALTLGWLMGVGLFASAAEGVLTAIALRHLERRAPNLVWDATVDAASSAQRQARKAFFAVAIALGVVLAIMPLSSSAPDALETVVERLRTLR